MACAARFARALEELWIAAFAWLPTPVGVALRMLAYKPLFRHLGAARIGTGVTLAGCRNITLHDGVRIGRHCVLTANDGELVMARDACLSPGVHVGADGGSVQIGAQVAVGPHTVIRAANHRFDDVHRPIMEQGHTPGRVIIEDDVWIAANCTITPDVRIAHGAVVGAGAVVTRDVPPLGIVAGVPARLIGQRGKQRGENGEEAEKQCESGQP